MPANTVRVAPPRSSVSLSSLSAPSTCSAFAIFATRRSSLLKSSIEIVPPAVSVTAASFLGALHEVLVVADGVTCRQQACRIGPVQFGHIQETLDLLCQRGHDRLQVNRQDAEDLDRIRAGLLQRCVAAGLLGQL